MSNDKYLQATPLCDFDINPEIQARALELTHNCHEAEEIFSNIFSFVKELPYGLEDWDIPASRTLAKRWGMCSGKTNLLIAMLRSLRIPARYRVYQIRGDVPVWNWATQDDAKVRLVSAGEAHDHVDCEVYLGHWKICDPSRDTALEDGMRVLGLPLRRNAVIDAAGETNHLILASFDQWAKQRQQRRKFRENREVVFAQVNDKLNEIRTLGNCSSS